MSEARPGERFALTLDLENDWYLDEPGYDHLTFEYIDEFIALVDRLSVPLSVFVVGETLEAYPEAIDRLATELDAEFHLHAYDHERGEGDFRTDLGRGKEAFRNHFGRDPVGYREPYGAIAPEQFPILAEEGFAFDSSVFPSYRPGVYNNLDSPLEPHPLDGAGGLLEVPVGVFRGARVPFSQNYLKLLGRPLVESVSIAPLPRTLVYNVHLQDLFRTASLGELPPVKRRILNRNLDRSPDILEDTVERLRSRGYEPTSLTDIASQYSADDRRPHLQPLQREIR